MRLFTFKFQTGAGNCFNHRFEVLAETKEQAVELLRGSDSFRYLDRWEQEGDKEKIARGLETPRVTESPALLDWSILTDKEESLAGFRA